MYQEAELKKKRYMSQNLTRYLRHLLLVCPKYQWHAKAHFNTLVDTGGTLVFDFADNGQFLILVSKFILVQKTVGSDNLLSKGKNNICQRYGISNDFHVITFSLFLAFLFFLVSFQFHKNQADENI